MQQTKFRTGGLAYIAKEYSRFKSKNIQSEIQSFLQKTYSRASGGKKGDCNKKRGEKTQKVFK